MFELLRTHVRKRVDLTDEEFDVCTKFFIPKKIRRKQFLLQEGEVCKSLTFVTRGCLRSYTVDGAGEEHILQFAVEDWWISDLCSFLSGGSATMNIDAVEDSELLLLEKPARESLLAAVPKFERFFRLLLERHYLASTKRVVDSLSASAKDRYLSFLSMYPAISQRVPQSQIASYLGITPQSLSRIRHEMASKP